MKSASFIRFTTLFIVVVGGKVVAANHIILFALVAVVLVDCIERFLEASIVFV